MKSLVYTLSILLFVASGCKKNSSSSTTPTPVPNTPAPTNVLSAYSRWSPDQIMTVNLDTKDTVKKGKVDKHTTYQFNKDGSITFHESEQAGFDPAGSFTFINDTTMSTTDFLLQGQQTWSVSERNVGNNVDLVLHPTGNTYIKVFLHKYTQ